MIVLIIGGDQGIGAALASQLLKAKHQVIKTSRSYGKLKQTEENYWAIHCDITDETSMNKLNIKLKDQFSHIDWLINCAGVLHSDEYMPEKSLNQINLKQLNENYLTNAVGHLLLIKALQKLIIKAQNPLVTSISARIGSIDDNHLGGWYAYRMSKAAERRT